MSRLKDLFRTALSVRVKRKLTPIDQVPEIGARLTLDGMRMRVESPMSEDTWGWMVLHGWRECKFRGDRRRYVDLPKGAYERLRLAPPRQRDRVHKRIVDFVEKTGRYAKTA